MLNTVEEMQGTAFSMVGDTVMNIEIFSATANEMQQKKLFNEGFPIVGFGRITKYLRNNSVLQAFKS
jgi:hypothetical protein